MELWPAGPRRDIAHEALVAHILVLEARILELEAASRAVICLPDEGYAMREIQRESIIQALIKVDWVQKDAAALLHMTARVMNHRIKVLKITARDRHDWQRGMLGQLRTRPPIVPAVVPPAIVTPLAVIVPMAEPEPAGPEVAGPRSPYYLYDADGALLAVRSPSNDRSHRQRQEEQVVLMLEALKPYPERHRTKDLVAHLAERDARLLRRRRSRGVYTD